MLNFTQKMRIYIKHYEEMETRSIVQAVGTHSIPQKLPVVVLRKEPAEISMKVLFRYGPLLGGIILDQGIYRVEATACFHEGI